MESCIANRLNSLYVLYCNLEKKVNDSLIKGELEIVKNEMKSIKNETDSSIKEDIQLIKNELKSIKNETDHSIKEDIQLIKNELKSIKNETDHSIKEDIQLIKNETDHSIKEDIQLIKNETDHSIKEDIQLIKNEMKSIKKEFEKIRDLQYDKNLESTPNYLEYTTLYADFENNGVCIYCPSEPYEPDNDISFGPIIDNDIYTNLKNILNN
jgi:hypothetical protein